MDRIQVQGKIFGITAVLVLLAGLSELTVLPAILLDKSPGAIPLQAAGATLVGIVIHLYVAHWFGIRLRKRSTTFRREVFVLAAVGLFLLGFMIMDGAFAFLDDVRFVSFGFFLCSFFDFAGSLVCLTALVLLRPKKEK